MRIVVILIAFLLAEQLVGVSGQSLARPSTYPISNLTASNTTTLSDASAGGTTRRFQPHTASMHLVQGTNRSDITLRMVDLSRQNQTSEHRLGLGQILASFVGKQNSLQCNLIHDSVTERYFSLSLNRSNIVYLQINLITLPPQITSSELPDLRVSSNCTAFQHHDGTNSHYYNMINGSYVMHTFGNSATDDSDDFSLVKDYATRSFYRLNSATGMYESVHTHVSTVQFQHVELFTSGTRVASVEFDGLSNLTVSQIQALTDASFMNEVINASMHHFRQNGSILTPFSTYEVINATGQTIKYAVSPDLIRSVLFYQDASTNQIILGGKVFDFEEGASRNIIFQDQAHIKQILLNSPIASASVTISHRYLLITTASEQQLYRFVGVYCLFVRKMTLGVDFSGQVGEVIVQISGDNLQVALATVYSTNSSSYSVALFTYGHVPRRASSEDTSKVVNVVIPLNDTYQYTSSDTEMLWAYSFHTAVMTNIGINYYNISDGTLYSQVLPAVGQWHTQYMSATCGITRNLNDVTEFRLLLIVNSNYSSPIVLNLTDTMAPFSPGNSSTWVCSKETIGFRQNYNIFKVGLNGMVVNTPARNGSAWTAIDSKFDNVLFSDGVIETYNLLTGAFVPYATIAGTLMSNSSLFSSGDILTYIGVEGNDTRIVIYKRVNLLATLVHDHTHSYTNTPILKISADNTKILISGQESSDGAGQVTNKIISFDFTTNTQTTVVLDTYLKSVILTQVYIFMDEKYIYVRQTSTSNTHMKQKLYWFKHDDRVVKLFDKSIPSDQTQWLKTLLRDNDASNSVNIFKEIPLNPPNIAVRKLSVSQQMEKQPFTVKGISVAMGSSSIKFCSEGCSECSTGICTACYGGYIYETDSSVCLKCPAFCDVCPEDNTATCITCVRGTFLNGTTCLPCDDSCLTCQTAPTQCIECKAGKYPNGGQCQDCPSNCKQCLNATNCLTCDVQYTVTSSGSCLKCGIGCTSCTQGDIIRCSSCASRFYLNGTDCAACPTNCVSCASDAYCLTCRDGYRPDFNGVCQMECDINCASCLTTSSTTCSSCYQDFMLSSTVCVYSPSCNSTYSCFECGATSNHYLSDLSQCLLCNAGSDCMVCHQEQPTVCQSCKPMHYLSNGQCQDCQSPCKECSSSNFCLSCRSGYTFLDGQSGGSCEQCHPSCVNCYLSPKNCLECASGYGRVGTICKNDKNGDISVTLDTDQNTVLNNMPAISQQIKSKLANGNTSIYNDLQVTILSIETGSAVVTASFESTTASSATLQQATSNFQSAVASNSSFAGYTVVSSSSSSTEGSTTTNGTSNTNSTTTITGTGESSGGISGGAIGGIIIAVLVVIGGVVALIIYKRRKGSNYQESSSQHAGLEQKQNLGESSFGGEGVSVFSVDEKKVGPIIVQDSNDNFQRVER